MALSNVRHGFRRRLYLSQAKESSYGTAATLTHVFDLLENSDVPVLEVANATDGELASGIEYPVKQYTLERSLNSPTFRMWASPASVGWSFAYALGDDAVTDTTGDYRHLISPIAIGSFIGSFTMQHHGGGATVDTNTDTKFSGCVVESVELTGGRTGFLQLALKLSSAVAAIATGSSQTESGLDKADAYIPINKCKWTIVAASAENTSEWSGTYTQPTSTGVMANSLSTDISQHVESFAIRHVNPIVADRAAGSSSGVGIYAAQPVITRRSTEIDLTLVLDDTTDDFIKALQNSTHTDNAEYTLAMEFVTDVAVSGGNVLYSGYILFPLVGFRETPKPSSTFGAQMLDVKFFAKHDTTYGPIRVYVNNAESAVYNA